MALASGVGRDPTNLTAGTGEKTSSVCRCRYSPRARGTEENHRRREPAHREIIGGGEVSTLRKTPPMVDCIEVFRVSHGSREVGLYPAAVEPPDRINFVFLVCAVLLTKHVSHVYAVESGPKNVVVRVRSCGALCVRVFFYFDQW